MARLISERIELALRMLVASLSVIVLAYAAFCSAKFGQHFVATYIITILIAVYSISLSIVLWGIISGRRGRYSSTALGCSGLFDFVCMLLASISIAFMGLVDWNRTTWRYDPDTGEDVYVPYVADPWRLHALFIESTVCGLQFVLFVLLCVGCCRSRARTRRERRSSIAIGAVEPRSEGL